MCARLRVSVSRYKGREFGNVPLSLCLNMKVCLARLEVESMMIASPTRAVIAACHCRHRRCYYYYYRRAVAAAAAAAAAASSVTRKTRKRVKGLDTRSVLKSA